MGHSHLVVIVFRRPMLLSRVLFYKDAAFFGKGELMSSKHNRRTAKLWQSQHPPEGVIILRAQDPRPQK